MLQQTTPEETVGTDNIIQSLLDIDAYKLTMSQHAFTFYPDAEPTFKFINRTDYNLGEYIDLDRLRAAFDEISKLELTDEEAEYLRNESGIDFSEAYINYLKDLKLPELHVDVNSNDRLEIWSTGEWAAVTLWETIVLSTVNQLFGESIIEDNGGEEFGLSCWAEGQERLMKKMDRLNNNNHTYNIVDFGTRRRHSSAWHEFVIMRLTNWFDDAPGGFNLVGTSNVHLARKNDLKPIGTFAHEMPMIYSGLFAGDPEQMRNSHNKFLDDWYELYGKDLSIALSDTYGTQFFFDSFGRERAAKWRGLRHDSGDPFEFGDATIRWYAEKNIDPTEKTIIFSDGLSADKIMKLEEYFEGRIQTGYGWGTKLTNDTLVPQLSIVMKAVEVNGNGLVKLSDNLAKATGKDKDVEYYKEVFGHDVTLNESLDV